jgi:serine/threonine protein kinase
MAALSHPNLATIFAADVWRGTPLLVVEYLHGGTLQNRLRHGPLDPGHVLEVGAALAAALEHMHGRAILHRDIKPSNIGFDATGTPKLLDFGLAKILVGAGAPRDAAPTDATTSTNGHPGTASADLLIGTPAYFSPELAALEPADYSSDLWALSLSLYEAISGTNPMAGASPLQTLERIATVSVPALDTVRPDVPAAVATGFRRVLSRNRAERPQSASELRDELVKMKGA